MPEFLIKLFSSDFMPHGYCYLWNRDILWLHATSDGLIAIAYYVIPVLLVYLVRKRGDLPFHWMFLMFGVFIFGCGTTHAMEVWTLWHGTYRLAGVIKAVTAGASLGTAAFLIPLVPRALALTSPAQLQAANLELEKEICERRRVEEELQRARSELELRVQQRTAELSKVNQELQQDVAERIQAERALRESEHHLMLAQSAARLGVWDLDLSTNAHAASGEYLQLYGLPLDYPALPYQEWLGLIHPDDRGRIDALLRETLEQGRIWDAEFRVVWPDGGVHWLLGKGTVFLDDSGQPVRIAGVNLDITDRKQAEADARRSLDEIAHLNRVAAMGELTASLAHELNQPLAAILSNAQAANRFLGGESADLAQALECLKDIVADDKRAEEVIKRLRALLRKEESGTTQVDLNEVVADVIRLLQHEAMMRQASVAFEPSPNLPAVVGDRVQLYQVVLNLIVNGLEASAKQGPGDRWLKVRTIRSSSGAVEMTVEDSGKGIAESELTRVFEPFFTTKPDGLGMGLSISRSIVQAHGGRLWAENSADGGAMFRCVLAAAQQTAATAR